MKSITSSSKCVQTLSGNNDNAIATITQSNNMMIFKALLPWHLSICLRLSNPYLSAFVAKVIQLHAICYIYDYWNIRDQLYFSNGRSPWKLHLSISVTLFPDIKTVSVELNNHQTNPENLWPTSYSPTCDTLVPNGPTRSLTRTPESILSHQSIMPTPMGGLAKWRTDSVLGPLLDLLWSTFVWQ